MHPSLWPGNECVEESCLGNRERGRGKGERTNERHTWIAVAMTLLFSLKGGGGWMGDSSI